MIEKFPGANTREVTKGVDAALADMAPGLTGITINPDIFRPVSYVDAGLGNVAVIALIALVLLVAGMLLLQASWRAAVVALVVVPVSLTVAAYVLYLLGTTFTTITLLGLAAVVGLVIDDVVTDIDAVRRRLAQPGHEAGTSPRPPWWPRCRRRAGRWYSPPSPSCWPWCRSCSWAPWRPPSAARSC